MGVTARDASCHGSKNGSESGHHYSNGNHHVAVRV